MSGSVSFDNLSRLMRTSESFSDLNAELNPAVAASASAGKSRGPGSGGAGPTTNSAKANEETTNKPFGLGKPLFLGQPSLTLFRLENSNAKSSAANLVNFFIPVFAQLH